MRKYEILEHAKGKVEKSRLAGNNTLKVEYVNGDTGYILYKTEVVRIKPNGNIILNSGGYRTNTTKARINDFTNISVSQLNNVWYANEHVFYDGIEFNDEGKLVSKDITIDAKAQRKVLKIISDFTKQIKDLETIPTPNNGDCWYCSMFEGSNMGNNDHLIQHVKENYIHGSLIVNSLLHCNYSKEQLPYVYSNKDTLQHSLYRYLKDRLVLNETDFKGLLTDLTKEAV